jgi:hypothetical protein
MRMLFELEPTDIVFSKWTINVQKKYSKTIF